MGVLTGIFGGLFWDVVVAWGNLEAFRAFLGYLGAARNIMVPLGPLLLFGGYFGTIPAYKG